jgi:hypothetical protein
MNNYYSKDTDTYFSKYCKYKKKYLDLKAGATAESKKSSDVMVRHKGMHSLRFSNEISKLNPNLLEYEEDQTNEEKVITRKLPNSTNFYNLSIFVTDVKKQCLNLLGSILEQDEEFAHYKKVTEKFINRKKENEKPLFKWVLDKFNVQMKPSIEEAKNILAENGPFDYNSSIHKANEIFEKHFKSFVALPDRIVNEIIEALRIIVTKKWILKDFNKGNIVFYYEILPNEGDNLTSFFNDNLKVKLIDWKYVFSPEQNEENNFSAWDSRESLVANMLPMKTNMQILSPLVIGDIRQYIEEFDKIIKEYRK